LTLAAAATARRAGTPGWAAWRPGRTGAAAPTGIAAPRSARRNPMKIVLKSYLKI